MTAFGLTPILDTGQGAAQNPLPEGNPWISGVESGTANHPMSRNGTGGLYATEPDVENRWPTVFSADQEMYAQLTTVPLVTQQVVIFTRISFAPSLFAYMLIYVAGAGATAFQLARYVGGSFTLMTSGAGIALVDGDWIGMNAIGNTVSVFAKRAAGAWQQVLTRTDTNVTAAGQIGLGMVNPGHDAVWANVGGGEAGLPAQGDRPLLGRGAIR